MVRYKLFLGLSLALINSCNGIIFKVVGLTSPKKDQKIVLLYDQHVQSAVRLAGSEFNDEIRNKSPQSIDIQSIETHNDQLRQLLANLARSHKKTSVELEMREYEYNALKNYSSFTASDALGIFAEYLFKYGEEPESLNISACDPRVKDDILIINIVVNFFAFKQDGGTFPEELDATIESYLNLLKSRIAYIQKTYKFWLQDMDHENKAFAQIIKDKEADFLDYIAYVEELACAAGLTGANYVSELMSYAIGDNFDPREAISEKFKTVCNGMLLLGCDYFDLFTLSRIIQSKDSQVLVACGSAHAEKIRQYLRALRYKEELSVPEDIEQEFYADGLAKVDAVYPVEDIGTIANSYFTA